MHFVQGGRKGYSPNGEERSEGRGEKSHGKPGALGSETQSAWPGREPAPGPCGAALPLPLRRKRQVRWHLFKLFSSSSSGQSHIKKQEANGSK